MEKPTCTIDGCDSEVVARGWCDKHYRRAKKHGDPGVVKEIHAASPAESFKLRTRPDGDCLIWTGASTPAGYGIIAIKGRNAYAHRWAWEQANGPIPDGMHIDHLCFNAACCEVQHLRMVTPKQNQEHRQGAQANSSSGVHGVGWDKARKKWTVGVKHHGKVIYGGRYADLQDAIDAVRSLRLKLFTHSDADKAQRQEA